MKTINIKTVDPCIWRLLYGSLYGVICGLVCGVIYVGTASARPTLTIPSKVNVTQNEVTLGEIARFKGFRGKDLQLAKTFVLGPSPIGGTRQQFPRAYLKHKLKSAPLPQKIKIKLPKVLTIVREKQILSAKKLARKIEDAIRAQDPGEGEELALLKVPQQSNLNIPAGATLHINVLSGIQGGRVPVEIRLKDGARLIRSQRVFVEVDFYRTVVALKRKMNAGTTLKAQDLIEIKVPSASLKRDSILKRVEIEGARLKQTISAKIPLRNAWLWTPPLIKRGARVQMIFKRKGILLTAEGESLGMGRRGDMIKIRNSRSRKIVTGRVVAPNQVEMEF